MKACLVPILSIFTVQIQHFLNLIASILKCLKLDLRIFKCILSDIELNLNILVEIFKVLVCTYCFETSHCIMIVTVTGCRLPFGKLVPWCHSLHYDVVLWTMIWYVWYHKYMISYISLMITTRKLWYHTMMVSWMTNTEISYYIRRWQSWHHIYDIV